MLNINSPRIILKTTPWFAFVLSVLCTGSPVLAGPPHAEVTAQDFSFSPANLTIELGQTVEWSNIQGVHDVVADDGSFSSGAAAPAPWTFTHTFDAEGTFAYHCTLHGGPGGIGMSGVVTVQGAGDPGSITVVKNAIGSDGIFQFSSDLPDIANFSITTVDGFGAVGPVSVNPGTYSIIESVPTGWDLTEAGCDNGDSTDAVDIGPGEDVACIFENTQVIAYEDRFEVQSP